MYEASPAGISPELAHAFAQTLFEVYGPAPITLQIGQRAEAATQWLDRQQARSALVITGWNPFGRAQGIGWNDRANSQLIYEVDQLGLRHLPARGISATGDWYEDSLCVFDVSAAQIDAWLARFRQAAVVQVRHGQPPELVWHPLYRTPAPN